ncbi:hypothetical protein, partial [Segetibacter sp.]|uniref:hypothetical protein n=1 Tax=Segetibacter sp. TaxID=2231182 RepID=UPI0026341B8B
GFSWIRLSAFSNILRKNFEQLVWLPLQVAHLLVTSEDCSFDVLREALFEDATPFLSLFISWLVTFLFLEKKKVTKESSRKER